MKPDFTNYDVEDFTADEGFVAWVTKNENAGFWTQFCNEHPDKDEVIKQAQQMVKALSQKENVPNVMTKARVWKRIDQSTTRTSVVRRLLIAASVAAACVAMFYISGMQSSSEDVQLVNESQEATEHVLPDQSIVVLSPGASVLYNSRTYLTDRKIKLKGRAFFEVEKGSPFAVISAQGIVEVLGTSFDVNAVSQQYKVVCYTGKVKVSYAQYMVTLTPGERTAFEENKEHKVQFDLPSSLQPDWLSTYVAFENESLQKVIREIEVIYGVKVEIEPSLLIGVKHTGHVVKDDIEKALTSITWPHHLTFELEGEVVKIVQKVE